MSIVTQTAPYSCNKRPYVVAHEPILLVRQPLAEDSPHLGATAGSWALDPSAKRPICSSQKQAHRKLIYDHTDHTYLSPLCPTLLPSIKTRSKRALEPGGFGRAETRSKNDEKCFGNVFCSAIRAIFVMACSPCFAPHNGFSSKSEIKFEQLGLLVLLTMQQKIEADALGNRWQCFQWVMENMRSKNQKL